MKHKFAAMALLPLAVASFANDANAAQLVVNGGFEVNGGASSQTFTGWTVFNQAGGNGSFYVQTGMTSPPPSPVTVDAPPQGAFAAMTTQQGPGTHIIYQDIAIPAGVTATFSAKVHVRSLGSLSTQPSLDYTSASNQQARVDIMNPAAPLQDVGAGVLLNVFQTATGGAQIQPYATITANLTPFAGTTVRLRFAETDNLGNFRFGVDDVKVQTSALARVPTLSEWSLILMSSILAMIGIARTRRGRLPMTR
ncbi:MAG: IPTL-CTERM sorting domain-containing protein [Acidovorax sp.]|nr:IPTL-CTERM sorting domain-containing protein [Acidovorax sp.]